MSSLLARRIRGRPDERGSVIVALVIIMIVMLIGSMVALRTIGNEQIVVNRQSNFAGVAQADAGLADALFRLDQGPTRSYLCVKQGDTQCDASVVPGAPGVSYIARTVPANTVPASASQWVIQALGTVSGVPGAVQETVTRTAQYPFALFGQNSITFNGNGQSNLGNYDPTQIASATNPNPNGPVAIGSDGAINCNGGVGSNVTAVYYSAGGAVGTCGNPKGVASLYQVPVKQPPPLTNCPNGGQLGSLASPIPFPILPAGTYVCNNPVTINGNLAVSGPVTLYISIPAPNSSSTTDLDIVAGSTINYNGIVDNSGYCNLIGTQLPDATQLQIFTNGAGLVGDSNGKGFCFGGILYAPQASLTGNGCKSSFYGAVTINVFTCNGGPNLSFYYDSALGNLYGPWITSGYTQIKPSTVQIPCC